MTERSGISKLSFSDAGSLNELSGMSGSPILAVRHFSNGEVRYCFAGMLIQGSIGGKCGYFIQSAVVMDALKRFIKGI